MIKNFLELFELKNNLTFDDRDHNVQLKFTCDGIHIKNLGGSILSVLKNFPKRDEVVIRILDGENILRISNDNYSYNQDYEVFVDSMDDTALIEISLDINKKVGNSTFSIYNYERFTAYFQSKNFIEKIKMFTTYFEDNEKLILEMFDSDKKLLTNTICFQTSPITKFSPTTERIKQLSMLKETTNFINLNEIKLIPEDFNLLTYDEDNVFNVFFDKVKSLLSLAYISSTSYLNSDILNAKICGQIQVSNEFNLANENTLIPNDELYKIYEWIYSDGNPSDKIIIAHNIIGLHCKNSIFTEIDYKTLASIRSNYAVYQRDNANHYIEIKNKVADYINDIVTEMNSLVHTVLGSVGKSILAFLTYILTVFFTSLVGLDNLPGIFTKDITYITYAVLAGALVFIFITFVMSKMKIKRYKEIFALIKDNYKGLFDSKDLENILNEKNVLTKNIERINHWSWVIFPVWLVFLFILFLIVEYLSAFSIVFFTNVK